MRHQKRVRAEEAARRQLEILRRQDAAALADAAKGNAAFELLTVELENARKALHELPQGEARRERKKRLLAQYLPMVEAFLAGPENYQNPVLMWCLIWSCDIGDLAGAQRLADAAIERNQAMPHPPFGKDYTVKLFWADSVLTWATLEFAAGRSVNPYFPDMFGRVMEWPVHDVIKAKYYKLAALIAEKNEAIDEALAYAVAARDVGAGAVKVKTLIARLEKAAAAKAEAGRRAPKEPDAGGGGTETEE